MKIKNIILAILIGVCPIFMTGCWDKVEIDSKIFIISMGIDVGKDINKEKNLKSSGVEFSKSPDEINKLKVTYSFPNLKMIKEGSAETQNINIDAYSLADAESKFYNRSSKALYLGHTKILFLSSEIFQYKDTVKEILDYIDRKPSLGKNIMVLVCDGKAEDYIKFKSNIEENIENYVSGIINNSKKNGSIQKVTLNDFLSAMRETGDILIPEIKMNKEKKEVLLNEMAIIKNYSMVGNLSDQDILDMEILKGKLRGGKKFIIYKGHPLDYVINNSKRTIRFNRQNGKLIFNIDIDLEGKLDSSSQNMNLLSEEQLNDIEDNFSKVIKDQCERFIEVSKDKYNTDFIGLEEYVKRHQPNVWKEIGGNWKKEFKDSSVMVNVRCDIRRIGATK